MSKIILLTGMYGVGKTTIAKEIYIEAYGNYYNHDAVYLLDDDITKKNLYPELGFTKEDRENNLERATWLANFLADGAKEVLVIMAYVAPYPEMIEEMRKTIECEFLVISLEAPLEVLGERDPKGLYKKALSGEIKNFAEITDPYIPPKLPDYVIDTNKCTIDDSVRQVHNLMYDNKI